MEILSCRKIGATGRRAEHLFGVHVRSYGFLTDGEALYLE